VYRLYQVSLLKTIDLKTTAMVVHIMILGGYAEDLFDS
jgi:hypothetical protein